MNQILFGSLIPFLVGAAWYARRGCRASPRMLVVLPIAMTAAAVYAAAPDIPRLLGHYRLYERLSHDPRMDLFLWHYTIDRLEVDSWIYHAVLVAMAAVMLAVAWRELYLEERN
jgi:hypothetical protein